MTRSLLTYPTDRVRAASSARASALVFEDPASLALLARIERLAPSEANVLIIGETGTGKELIARHVHQLSHRHDKPFLAVNCGSLSETLIESELFGHERGAFTGAVGAKEGWFEAADGGTLFLDEIGDLPLPMQVKLLRVLQEREVVRVGSRATRRVDVRLVAATNVELERAVAAGRFREDLYYRLRVAVLNLPPLRERPGDILPLAGFFLAQHAQRLGHPQVVLDDETRRLLLRHPWPGNIRELENVIHHALLLCGHGVIRPVDLHLVSFGVPHAGAFTARPVASDRALPATEERPAERLAAALAGMFEAAGPELFERIEDTLFRSAFEFCHRNQVQTARLLGISRNIVRARLIRMQEIGPGAEGERHGRPALLTAPGERAEPIDPPGRFIARSPAFLS